MFTLEFLKDLHPSPRIVFRFPQQGWLTCMLSFLVLSSSGVHSASRGCVGTVVCNSPKDRPLLSETNEKVRPNWISWKLAGFNIAHSLFRICVPRSFPAGSDPANLSHLWVFQAKPFPETSGKQIEQHRAHRRPAVRRQLMSLWPVQRPWRGPLEQGAVWPGGCPPSVRLGTCVFNAFQHTCSLLSVLSFFLTFFFYYYCSFFLSAFSKSLVLFLFFFFFINSTESLLLLTIAFTWIFKLTW